MAWFKSREKLFGEVLTEIRELAQTRGRVTAREALALIQPTALETSSTLVLLTITSGSDITAEGRSWTWEFVVHFPTRLAQGVYSLEPRDPDSDNSVLGLKFRLSPRRDPAGDDSGLPLDFVDSPEAVRAIGSSGADWVAGDPDMTLATKRLPSGEVVWTTESYGKVFTTAFAPTIR